MRKSLFVILILILVLSDSCVGQKNKSTLILFETTYGNITLKLYPETIKHHDNFVKLVNNGFYNGVLFHRVISGFMIQAGDPDSKTAKTGDFLGSGDVGYTIPAEFIYPKYYHKRGAICSAREGDNINPLKSSSGCQFYIVEGKCFSEGGLDSIDMKNKQKLEDKLFQEIVKTKQVEVKKYRLDGNQSKLNALQDSILKVVKVQINKDPSYKLTNQQRTDYKTIGGTPHLDGAYTVFGEVTEGLDIVANISNSKTGTHDRPLIDIRVINAKVLN